MEKNKKVEESKAASKSFTNRVSNTGSPLQNSFVFALAYCATHHYTLFAICSYALTMGVPNLFYLLVPTVIVNSVVNLAHVVYYLIAN